MFVQETRDGTDAQTRDGIVFIDLAHHGRLSVYEGVRRGRVLSLTDISVAIRCAAKNVDNSLQCTVPLAPARPLQNLRPFILGDHALELQQQLIFRCCCLGRFDEHRLDVMSCKFFN